MSEPSPKGKSMSTDDDGEWEVFSKKSKNRTGVAKPWGPPPNSTPKAWGNPESTMQKLAPTSNGGRNAGRGNLRPPAANKGWENAYMAPPPVIPPPLQHGWNWAARPGVPRPQVGNQGWGDSGGVYPLGNATGGDIESDVGYPPDQAFDDEDDDDADILSDDDSVSDGFDSDESIKSHGTLKTNKWFKAFFEALDILTLEQINESSRQWHCPACARGPGAIDWYRGLQPLMAHAKTKGATRVKLHREFAAVLDEEMIRRGTSVIPAGEVFGQWEGLRAPVSDREIVWPPMVIVMNTQLEQDENEKWIGMGNQELLDYFSSYNAVKARHSYGPQGHRGMSVLIFEGSPVGYNEAERLHKHFYEQGNHKDAWQHRRVLFYPGGKRQLYGYMASKEDLESFNRHCQGKTRLKFEMGSYNETVVQPLKAMSEKSELAIYAQSQAERARKERNAMAVSFKDLSMKLKKAHAENSIIRERTKKQHEEDKEEMEYQVNFFKEQIDTIHEHVERTEREFEERVQERLQAERDKVQQSIEDTRSISTEEKLSRFIQSQEKGVEEYEIKRELLIKLHKEKKAEMKKRHMEEEVHLEKEFEASMTNIMAEYERHLSEDGVLLN